MSIKKHIPNAITCCNLLCGCLAIVQAFEGNLVYAAYLVGLAAIFDFFDGFAARLLKVASPIGKDLDSLADMVTFGVVPGIVMYKLIVFLGLVEINFDPLHTISENSFYYIFCKYIWVLIPIFSAIRLAKFNNDTRQTSSFIGLPTPANAIFICSVPLILYHVFDVSFTEFIEESYFAKVGVDYDSKYLSGRLYAELGTVLRSYWFYFSASILLSYLLIAEIPLFALKFRNFSWRGNRIKYVFLLLSLVLLITLQFVGIPLIIILYVLISVITNFYMKRKIIS